MNINDDQVYFFRCIGKKLYKSKDEVVCVVVREWRGTLVKILFNIKRMEAVWPRERLWCIRKSLCTVHKSQHNCFLHPQMKPNKTKQNEPNAESSISSSTPSFIIITLPECQNHFTVEMVSVSRTPKPFCYGNGFQNLQSHHQHRRSSSSPYRNAKTILLWKWFPKSSISSSTPSFIIITVPECQNHFVVENH